MRPRAAVGDIKVITPGFGFQAGRPVCGNSLPEDAVSATEITGAADLQSIRASDFFDWQSRALSIGPSVSWPIFEGGRIRANIELQTAAQQELLAAYKGIVLQAFQDVEDALVAFSHEQATRAQLEDAVRANQRAAELARNLYGQGLTDFLTVPAYERVV